MISHQLKQKPAALATGSSPPLLILSDISLGRTGEEQEKEKEKVQSARTRDLLKERSLWRRLRKRRLCSKSFQRAVYQRPSPLWNRVGDQQGEDDNGGTQKAIAW